MFLAQVDEVGVASVGEAGQGEQPGGVGGADASVGQRRAHPRVAGEAAGQGGIVVGGGVAFAGAQGDPFGQGGGAVGGVHLAAVDLGLDSQEGPLGLARGGQGVVETDGQLVIGPRRQRRRDGRGPAPRLFVASADVIVHT